MKSGGPWSVKGIEPEVRETAKSAARRAGKTLGEWLNQIIMDTGQNLDPALWESLDSPAPWNSAISDLAARFEKSERRHHQLLQNIDVARVNEVGAHRDVHAFGRAIAFGLSHALTGVARAYYDVNLATSGEIGRLLLS